MENNSRDSLNPTGEVTSWVDKLNLFMKVSNGTAWLGVLSLPIMFILTTIDVFFRYILESPLVGVFEIQKYLFLFIAFSGFAYCWNEDAHIYMNLIIRKLGTRGKAIFRTLACIVGIILFGLTLYGEINAIGIAKASGSASPELKIPEWPFHIVAVILLLIFVVQLLISMVQSMYQAIKGE